jgi:hypothetical protein
VFQSLQPKLQQVKCLAVPQSEQCQSCENRVMLMRLLVASRNSAVTQEDAGQYWHIFRMARRAGERLTGRTHLNQRPVWLLEPRNIPTTGNSGTSAAGGVADPAALVVNLCAPCRNRSINLPHVLLVSVPVADEPRAHFKCPITRQGEHANG